MARGCRNKIASPYESEPQNNLQTIPLNTVFFVFFTSLGLIPLSPQADSWSVNPAGAFGAGAHS